MNDLKAADFELRRTADLDVSYLTQVLDLVWRFYEDPDPIMATHVPVIPLYQMPIVLVHRSDLLGMHANPGVSGPFWNIEDWHWRS